MTWYRLYNFLLDGRDEEIIDLIDYLKEIMVLSFRSIGPASLSYCIFSVYASGYFAHIFLEYQSFMNSQTLILGIIFVKRVADHPKNGVFE